MFNMIYPGDHGEVNYMYPFEQLGPARKWVTCAHASLAGVASIPVQKKSMKHRVVAWGREHFACKPLSIIYTCVEGNNN